MIQPATIDIRGLDAMMKGLQNALVGSGQDGDIHLLLKSEARALATKCSELCGPKTQERGRKRIEAAAKKVFHPMMNSKTGEPWSLFKGPQADGNGTRWLYAGPTFLAGVAKEDYRPDLDAVSMRQILRQDNSGLGRKAWQDMGEQVTGIFTRKSKYQASRGKQHVMILRRIAVKPAKFNALVRDLGQRVGRMRATFAYTAAQYGAKFPKWISDHFNSVKADGRAVFNDTKMQDPVAPAIEFGSTAPGITEPFFAGQINAAVKAREHILAEKLKKVLSGYTYDWNTGGVFKRKGGIE